MENKYEKYWIEKEKEWHGYQVGKYHVSSIGADNQNLNKNDHYGPCLRATFYDYTDKIEDKETSTGNKFIGTILHEKVQEITRKNNRLTIVEFPLIEQVVTSHNDIITLLGSVDLVEFEPYLYDGKYRTIVNLYDFKTASEYTLPKHDEDYNPTYFNQLKIYAHMLNELFDFANVIINKLVIVYINKHNLATYEIIQNFDEEECFKIFDSFVHRADYLHECLKNNALPKAEPMRWCKYCKYQARCRANALSDEDIPNYDEEELVEIFERETGKRAYWHGNETKGFQEWKKKNG